MSGPIDKLPEPDSFSSVKRDDLFRGETPLDIEKKCLQLCQTYIGGVWKKATSEKDVTIKRITGGLTNQLFRVRLNENIAKLAVNDNEVTDVAYKMYQSKHLKYFDEKDSERLSDTLMITILSHVGIGPEVYGIFKDGYISRFYENEEFGQKHQRNPQMVRKLAQTLAQFHHLKAPIRKSTDLMVNQVVKMFDHAYEKCDAQSLIDESNLEHLSKLDPRKEYQYVIQWIRELNSPVVLCHNDFRGCNILVIQPNEDIKLVDLEYTAYGYRGHDISNFLQEWGRQTFDVETRALPEDDVVRSFIRLYIEACDQLSPGYSNKPGNSVEAILKEVKMHTLEGAMFFLAFMMQSEQSLVASMPFDKRANMKYADSVCGKYLTIKQRLIDDGILKI